jgi:hypothetical protein
MDDYDKQGAWRRKIERKVDGLCDRFDQHLSDEQTSRAIDLTDRNNRQQTLDKRLDGIEAATREILDIKRSWQITLSATKWFVALAASIGALWKSGILHDIARGVKSIFTKGQ